MTVWTVAFNREDDFCAMVKDLRICVAWWLSDVFSVCFAAFPEVKWKEAKR